MDIKLHDNYVYTRQLDLDIEEQKTSALLMYEYIIKTFIPNPKTDYKGKSTATTNLYEQYNYLMYPVPGLHDMFNSIKETFHACNAHYWNNNPPKDKFYLQCWLNLYRKGEFIDWHGHWHEDFNSWHGFYCVDVEPNSYTTYRVVDKIEEIVIPSKDNLLVISRSGSNTHRSSEWDSERPRITVAFDIVPAHKLHERGWNDKNHWIPI